MSGGASWLHRLREDAEPRSREVALPAHGGAAHGQGDRERLAPADDSPAQTLTLPPLAGLFPRPGHRRPLASSLIAGLLPSRPLDKRRTKPMLITLMTVAFALLAGGLLATTAGLLVHRALADQPTVRAVKKAGNQETADVRGVVKAVDVSRNTMTIYPGKKVAGEKTFALARDVKI